MALRSTNTKSATQNLSLSLHHIILLCAIILAKLCGIAWFKTSTPPPTLTNESKSTHSEADIEYNYLGQDYPQTWPIPPLHQIRMSLEETTHYQLAPTPSSNAEWESLYPENGVIHLGERRQEFSISMFHQLRCVDVLRREVVRSAPVARDDEDEDMREVNGDDEVSGRSSEQSELGSSELELAQHCINYLRQMALCRSDLYLSDVLAAPKPKPYPDTYVCRDWEEVYDAVRTNQEEYRKRA